MTKKLELVVPHPSVYMREELAARGWSLDRLTSETDPPDKHEWGIRRLALDFYFEVGPDEPEMVLGESADYLAVAFDVDAEFFRNLERRWRASKGVTV